MSDQDYRKADEKVTRLTDLEVREVSLVDHPANEEVFLLLKRLDSEFEHLEKAVWSTAFVNDLPDSSFLYIEPGGKKDEEGKTVPRTLRHFPVRDGEGDIDLPHLRNALSRIPQSGLPQSIKERLTREASRLLEESKDEVSKDLIDETQTTTETEGEMIRKDSPIYQATETAVAKNDAEKAENEAEMNESEEVVETKKDAHEAAELADASMKLAETLRDSIEGLADMDEFKSLMAALAEMKAYHAAEMKGGEEEKGGHKDDEMKTSEDEEMKSEDEEMKSEEAEKAEEEPEKAEEAEEVEEAEKADPVGEIRSLIAELHSKLEASSGDVEKEIAKGIDAVTERLDRLADRVNTLETTRGISRGEADNVEKSVKEVNLFHGLI